MARKRIPDVSQDVDEFNDDDEPVRQNVRAPGRGGAGEWNPAGVFITGKEVERITGISTKSIYNWNKAGCPGIVSQGPGRDTMVDLGEVMKWREARAELKGENNSAKVARAVFGDEEMDAEKLELFAGWEDLRIKEIKRKQMQGALLPKALVFEMVSTQLGMVVSRFRGIGSKLKSKLAIESDPDACQKLIDAEVDASFARIAADDGSGDVDAERVISPPDEEQDVTQINQVEEAPKPRRTRRKVAKPRAKKAAEE